MSMIGRRISFAAGLLLIAAGAAQAQTGRNYDVKTMNFDLWCQETAHLPAARCDKRTPEDENTFESFRTKIEQYEVPYLQQKNKDARLDTDILHNDPIDRPESRANSDAQRQSTGQSAPTPTNAPP